jgi:hypothetical protein
MFGQAATEFADRMAEPYDCADQQVANDPASPEPAWMRMGGSRLTPAGSGATVTPGGGANFPWSSSTGARMPSRSASPAEARAHGSHNSSRRS